MIDIKLENNCSEKRGFCVNCASEFMKIRPLLTGVIVSKHFFRDLERNEEEVNSIIVGVLDCSNLEFTELHKFEENINGNLIFRAKKDGTHIVYCIDKTMKISFLRAFKNFNEYKKFLEDKKGITRIIKRLS
jgi:hypothetical protein